MIQEAGGAVLHRMVKPLRIDSRHSIGFADEAEAWIAAEVERCGLSRPEIVRRAVDGYRAIQELLGEHLLELVEERRALAEARRNAAAGPSAPDA